LGFADILTLKIRVKEKKFAILVVEATAWKGAKTEEYLDIPSFRNAARQDV
jgi:hypothetical protein